MARSSTTQDVFNAIGDANRRNILNALLAGEMQVRAIVADPSLSQPQVSRHQRTAVIEFPSDLEVVVTREFDAPIELVFDGLTREGRPSPRTVETWLFEACWMRRPS